MITIDEVNQTVYAFVFARGGSKGVPRKNIRDLAGKPLISYAINCALSSAYVDKVIVSTDDSNIAAISERCGAEVPFLRPEDLAGDSSSEWLAWQHALNFLRDRGDMPSIFLSVPATSPMRDVCDLNACMEKLGQEELDMVITASEAARSPYFNMIKMNSQGLMELAVKPGTPIVRRQDAPQFYDVATVAYAAKSQFILTHHGLFDGRVGAVIIPVERALDIDTELDFKIADFLIREKLG